jgi:ATP-dependent DNA ligase
MTLIKSILDEVAAEGGSNAKMDILKSHAATPLLKDVLYQAKSKRVKFYLKQIPEYTTIGSDKGLEWALGELSFISNRHVTGGEATTHLKTILESVSADDAYIVERIIDKDLKFGMGTSNINKVFSKLIEKTPYMGAKSFSEDLAKKIFEKGGVAVSQVKMDGRYCNAIIRGGEVELESRQGETTHVGDAKFLREMSVMQDCVLNGELTIDGLDRYTANGVVASIVDIEGKRENRGEEATSKKITAFEKKHGSYQEAIDGIHYTVWDMITIEEYFDKVSNREYAERASILTSTLGKYQMTKCTIVEGAVVRTYEEAMSHFQQILQRGEEGTILKALKGTWKDGKPNWQVKMKLDMSIDLRVIGFEYGEKGTKNENVYSTINLESSCGKLTTNSSGMKEAMMDDITERAEELMGTVVEIRCCGLSQNSKGEWSTLHPSVVALRDDKDTCDSLDTAIEIENMAKGLEKTLSND